MGPYRLLACDLPKGTVGDARVGVAVAERGEVSVVARRGALFANAIMALAGDVDDVVFPTGTVVEGDTLYIYYGAADELIAVASVSLPVLLGKLLSHR